MKTHEIDKILMPDNILSPCILTHELGTLANKTMIMGHVCIDQQNQNKPF